MLIPRKGFLGTLGGVLVALALERLAKPILDFEVQDFWKDKAQPVLPSSSAAMIEWAGPFWTGVGAVLAAWFVYEMLLAWRRSQSSHSENQLKPTDREHEIVIARECIAVSEEIAKERLRFDQMNSDAPSGLDPRDMGNINFAQFLTRRRATLIIGEQFATKALKALSDLEDLGIGTPKFDQEAGAAHYKPPLHRVIMFYLSDVGRFLGVIGRTLLDGDRDQAMRAAARWAPVPDHLNLGKEDQPCDATRRVPDPLPGIFLSCHDGGHIWSVRFEPRSDFRNAVLRVEWRSMMRSPPIYSLWQRKTLLTRDFIGMGECVNVALTAHRPGTQRGGYHYWDVPESRETNTDYDVPATFAEGRVAVSGEIEGTREETAIKFVILDRNDDYNAPISLISESLFHFTGEEKGVVLR